VSGTKVHGAPLDGQEQPQLVTPPPGPKSRAALARTEAVAAPMGRRTRAATPGSFGSTLVMASGRGSNVLDLDGNRYVDLAAGFGALLLGHSHPALTAALHEQSLRLQQALGDVYPSEAKLELLERLTTLYPEPAQAIVAQSGSDAVSAALKTAALHTGRPGVLAFAGAYHGLGYGPLAACGLRASYREPFRDQLNPNVRFVPYPSQDSELDATLSELGRELAKGDVGAILVEPILGRGGVIVPPVQFLPEISRRCREAGALFIADEIWTGLGRSGKLVFALPSALPDLICLGKGLGGGLPLSAVLGRRDVMESWRRDAEVVHTSTFAGAPLACAVALELLDLLEREAWIERARALGERFRSLLRRRLAAAGVSSLVRGEGLMVGVDWGGASGSGAELQGRLLERGYITSTGGGAREVLVLTPPLNIDEALLDGFADELANALGERAKQ
jgi:4-aminobutyrate aminotransferase/(S)-3-amino-2-methylpropionate transaminase